MSESNRAGYQVTAAGLNASNPTQEALRSALAASRVDDWLDDIAAMRPLGMDAL